jgi:hypothetical protein
MELRRRLSDVLSSLDSKYMFMLLRLSSKPSVASRWRSILEEEGVCENSFSDFFEMDEKSNQPILSLSNHTFALILSQLAHTDGFDDAAVELEMAGICNKEELYMVLMYVSRLFDMPERMKVHYRLVRKMIAKIINLLEKEHLFDEKKCN